MLAHTQPLAAETVALGASLGRTLAADVTASDPLPPFPASMMVHDPASGVQLHASVAPRVLSIMISPAHQGTRILLWADETALHWVCPFREHQPIARLKCFC